MFEKKSVGLDIADHTIEVVELQQSFFSSKPIISGRGRISLEPGIIEHGRIISKKRLQESFFQVLESAKPNPIISKSIVVGLPERQVYTSVIVIDCDHKNLVEQVMEAAWNTIPIEKDDLIVSYSVLSQGNGACEVLLYGISKEILQEWNDFFDECNISITTFDHELLAITRGLFGENISEPYCIIDLGSERTKIAVYSKKGMQYVYALEHAGDVFTTELAKFLGIPEVEAEKIKRDEGMNIPKTQPLFEKLLTPIVTEVKTALEYSHKGSGANIKNIILVGGSSRLIGLKEYLASALKLTVSHGSPFLLQEPNDIKDLSRLHYIEALGLAIRGLDMKKWERIHPSLKLTPH